MANQDLLLVSSALALAACASLGFAQTSPMPQMGIVPTGSYESYHIDAVNMDNGNNIIKIPLFSLPQLGKLSLSFSAVANSPMWEPEESCSTDDSTCSYWYTPITAAYDGGVYGVVSGGGGSNGVMEGTIGPVIVPDTLPAYVWSEYANPNSLLDCGDCSNTTTGYATLWSVMDGTGGSHALYYDSTNLTQLRSTDGSGFLFLSGMSNPSGYGPQMGGETVISGPILMDSHGIKYSYPEVGTYGNETVTDLDGNSMTVSASGITDSVQRFIAAIPAATAVSTPPASCPNLGNANQTVTAFAQWLVPGPNGQNQPYIICYATIAIRTDFFHCPYQHSCYSNWEDAYGNNYEMTTSDDFFNTMVIQSIVLPDKTYWGFLYDGGSSNANDVGHYGTISQVFLPTGGSINYGYVPYQPNNACTVTMSNGFPLGSMALATRTISDANGHEYKWLYSINDDYYYTPGTTVYSTDPNLNDTVYAGIGLGCGTDLETSRTYYQGSHVGGSVLRSTATSYQKTYAPVPPVNAPGVLPSDSYGNALAQIITTTLNSSVSTTTTNGFGGSFAATIPTYFCPSSCILVEPPSETAVSLSLSIPTSTTVADYSGAVLNTTKTSYFWQSSPTYYTANLLETPSVVITYNAQSLPVAQTTTTYDDTGYVAHSGVPAGHPTTVSHWNNNGNAVITHTAWNSNGMVNYTLDAEGNTSARYVYGSAPCSALYSSSSQYVGLFPTSVANALGQSTTYTWDCNTGKTASIKDPNNVLTNYSYGDPLGRLTQVQSASNTSAASDATYTYPTFSTPAYPPPSNLTVTKAQDRITVNDQNIKSSAVVDGLGREITDYLPNGSEVDTTYDGLDHVMSSSNPYFTTSDPTNGVTSYAYDALGRMLLLCNPDNGTWPGLCVAGNSYQQWVYSGNVTTFYNELRNSWQRSSDALGRLTNVVEPGALQTGYVYDPLGNLWTVTQIGNGTSDVPRTRTFSYDSLSRLACASNPENAYQPCPSVVSSNYIPGTVGYSYVQSGALCSGDASSPCVKTDARGISTTYSYDALNRILSKIPSINGNGTPLACFQYAASGTPIPYAVGRLINAWTQSSSLASSCSVASAFLTKRSILGYDPMGRVLNEQQFTFASQAASATYAPVYSYDLAENLLTSSTGSGPTGPITFTNTYNNAGQLLSVGSSYTKNGTYPATLFSPPATQPACQLTASTQYNAPGQLANATLGSVFALSRAFDNRLRTTCETDTNTGGGGAAPASAIVVVTGAEQSN